MALGRAGSFEGPGELLITIFGTLISSRRSLERSTLSSAKVYIHARLGRTKWDGFYGVNISLFDKSFC